MNVFFLLWGLLVWLAATLLFRLAGQWFLVPDAPVATVLAFLAAVPLIALVTYPVYRWRGLGPSERPRAALSAMLPGMLLDALVVALFPIVFPNMPGAGQLFAAWLLWAYGLGLLTGLWPSGDAARRIER